MMADPDDYTDVRMLSGVRVHETPGFRLYRPFPLAVPNAISRFEDYLPYAAAAAVSGPHRCYDFLLRRMLHDVADSVCIKTSPIGAPNKLIVRAVRTFTVPAAIYAGSCSSCPNALIPAYSQL
ncbi:hypothetical protein WOLCODRAFT_166607 [Wolfiporia cocos MD-104 SS10]|uniref:Uncharacterized protein n=1 Tax=Wolfiporia cocos (strain MD-104) TaxID=742152 RepID=A0A2H3JJ45_WOLCO|nr:hypothetical protein WOLCODRAFT_166607 [Wolfiporia cocos MD-104 SS10]